MGRRDLRAPDQSAPVRSAVAATMTAVLAVACGGVEPPPAVDGAIVGKVLVQGDTTLEFVGGPDPVVDTQVVVVGVDDLPDNPELEACVPLADPPLGASI